MIQNTDRLTALHAACREDYARGTAQRARAELAPARPLGLPDPGELNTAIRVGQRMLAAYGSVEGADVFAYAQAHGGLTEALRILLRALGAEPDDRNILGSQEVFPGSRENPSELGERCPAAHPEDLTPCDGPIVVTILDTHNAGADGCEHHGARLLASLDGGRVYPLPDAPESAAIRVFKAADSTRPFPWLTNAPRTRDDQLSRAEVRARGEGQ
ncbi:hypothetical protein [Streptomyces sp. NPDC051636]|uniref:hypothetical protein n=1 Tax=Streptomyces sp. NPDC051636 TaxID=3365663 RepID=UPI0037AAAE32